MERERAEVDVWITYICDLVTLDDSGLIKTVRNTISIHSNEVGRNSAILQAKSSSRAQHNFMRSLAAYSVITYVLQIRGSHNGNILLDTEGHIVHTDVRIMLSNSRGSVGFELAPFKLPQEYIDVLGGVNSEKFTEVKALLKKAFMAVRKHT
ncbi:kinase-like domain-containing protein [Dissophora ornata]|nr:Phosphatidylinositol 4-kinase pik1alpha (PI4-kinase)(PtdIns-4-kinase) [Dissophora ornata]KAI8605389.1 kinase-like domain-containing protein [Dissophora ornata]